MSDAPPVNCFWCTKAGNYTLLIVLLLFSAAHAAGRGRTLAFYSPDNLQAVSRSHDHFFRFSKWFNRYCYVHGVFPVTRAEMVQAASAQENNFADFETDPWGTPYRFAMRPDGFLVIGAGADMTFATDDDYRLESLYQAGSE